MTFRLPFCIFLRVVPIREDSEGVLTADALTIDVRKTDGTPIVETEGMPRIVIEDETSATGKTAGVTRVADGTEDPTVDEIRDHLENPKTSRRTRNPCRKRPILKRRTLSTVKNKKKNIRTSQ